MKQWIVTYMKDGQTRKCRVSGVNEDSAKFFAMQLLGIKEADILKVRIAAGFRKTL